MKVAQKRGRKPVAAKVASVNIAIDATKLELADEVAAGLDAMMPGTRHTRGDALRAAITRGLDAMREDIERRR